MSLSRLYRRYVADNPMALEGARAWRRFVRAGGVGGAGSDAGRGVNAAILCLLGLLYLWLLAAILRFGEDMSQGVLLLELVVLTLFVPASLYGAISGERERLTWDALVLTRLSPGQILVGKLLWRLAVVAGVALLFLPPLLFSHYAPALHPVPWIGGSGAGGVGSVGSRGPDYRLAELALAQAAILGWAFLLSGFTLWVSARTRRSVTSISLVAVALFAFVVLVPALAALFGGSDLLRPGDPPLVLLVAVLLRANPLDGAVHLLRFYTSSYYGAFDAALPCAYAAAGGVCLLGAWRHLRGLGAARRRS